MLREREREREKKWERERERERESFVDSVISALQNSKGEQIKSVPFSPLSLSLFFPLSLSLSSLSLQSNVQAASVHPASHSPLMLYGEVSVGAEVLSSLVQAEKKYDHEKKKKKKKRESEREREIEEKRERRERIRFDQSHHTNFEQERHRERERERERLWKR